MSWQAYIDDSLLATGCVDRALIFGHDGNVWASSDYFEMKDEERNVLLSSFLDPSQVRMNGLFVCGEKVFYS